MPPYNLLRRLLHLIPQHVQRHTSSAVVVVRVRLAMGYSNDWFHHLLWGNQPHLSMDGHGRMRHFSAQRYVVSMPVSVARSSLSWLCLQGSMGCLCFQMILYHGVD